MTTMGWTLMTERGKFITLEGGEGAGKSTQIRRLQSYLQAIGIRTAVTREPGGSAGAEEIRRLLLSNQSHWNARTDALLFAAARADHVDKVIEPHLADGSWVLCDRYIDSSRAYQGIGGELGDEYVMALHALGAVLMPDRTIILDVGADAGAGRTRLRDGDTNDRIGGRETSYHARVNEAFRHFADKDAVRMRVVDARGDIDEVARNVLAAMEDILPPA